MAKCRIARRPGVLRPLEPNRLIADQFMHDTDHVGVILDHGDRPSGSDASCVKFPSLDEASGWAKTAPHLNKGMSFRHYIVVPDKDLWFSCGLIFGRVGGAIKRALALDARDCGGVWYFGLRSATR